jgi:hypothetical protein
MNKVNFGKEKLQIFQPIDKRKIEEERILKKYSKLFRQKDLPITETCMTWGLCVGFGWMKLLDLLCSQLQWDIDKNNQPQLEFTQVKEKFGGLRAYNNGATEQQEGMISFAEFLSNYICEECGTMENVTQNEKGWILTLCDRCRGSKKQ